MLSIDADSKKSWVVALACFFIQILTFGLTEVSGLFFVATVPRFHTKRELASLPYTLTYCVRSAIGPFIGYLGRRFGIRKVTLIGSILSPIAVGACFFADDIISLIILWGIVFGFSLGLETSLLNVILNEHFVKHRVKANGLNTAGASIGNMILSPLIEYLVEDAYGLSGTFLIIAGLMLNSIPAAIILMLQRPKSNVIMLDNLKNSDIESALKFRTSLIPPVNAKKEKIASDRDDQNERISNTRSEQECIENTSSSFVYNTKSSLILDVSNLNRLPIHQDLMKDNDLQLESGENIGRFVVIPVLVDSIKKKEGLKNSKNKNGVFNSSLIGQTSAEKLTTEHKNKVDIINGNNILNCQKSDIRNELETFSSIASIDKQCRNKGYRQEVLVSEAVQSLNNGKEDRSDDIKFEIDDKDKERNCSIDYNFSTAISEPDLRAYEFDKKNTDCRTYSCNSFKVNSSSSYQTTVEHISIVIPTINVTAFGNNRTFKSVSKSTNRSEWHVHRLICEPVYIFLLVGSGIYYFSITTFLTIVVDYATDIGLSIEYSTYILIWIGVSDILGYIFLGYIIERGYLTQSRFAALGFICMSITSVAMVWSKNYIMLLALVTVFEFSQATVIILTAPLVAEYIADDLQATAIASVTILSAPITLTISPLIGFFRDEGGSYAGVFYVISCCTLFCSLLFLCIPKSKQRQIAQE